MDQFGNEEYSEEIENQTDPSDMVASEEPEEQTEAEPQPKVGGYRFLAVLFMLLGVGGLFLGMLGKVVSAFAPIGYFSQYGATLDGALAGYTIDYFTALSAAGIGTIFKHGAEAALTNIVDILFAAGLFAVALFTVVAFIVSLASRKSAKAISFASGIAVFTVYCGLFLWSLFYMGGEKLTAFAMGGEKLSAATCSIPTAIIAAVSLIALCVAAMAKHKYGVANSLLLILPVLIAFVTVYPLSFTLEMAHAGIFSFKSFAFIKIALLFFMIAIAFNLFASAVRIPGEKAYPFDCVRFTVLLLGALLTAVAFIVQMPDDRFAIFKGKQLVYTLAYLLLSVFAFVIAVVMTVVSKRAAKAEAAEEEEEPEEEYAEEEETPEEEEEDVSYTETSGTPETYTVSEPAPEQTPEPAPETAPVYSAPVLTPEPEPAEAEPVKKEPEPYQPVRTPEPKPYRPASEPVQSEQQEPAPSSPYYPSPAQSYYAQPPYAQPTRPEPAYSAPVRPQPEPRKEAPISEFERRMEALARGEQPEYEPPRPQPQPMPSQPYLSPLSRNSGMMGRPSGYADANQYTYDPFINSLSPSEKNEFGDIFIACKAGRFEGLPTYSIGGDNAEFFRKVFIYLGKFRKDISRELLDKLYLYVSKNS